MSGKRAGRRGEQERAGACMAERGIGLALLVAILLCVTGCESIGGFQAMGPSEHGVVFSELPPFLGGGLKDKLIRPSEKEFVMPWEKLYRLDTGVQSVSWGRRASGGKEKEEVEEDFVQTRALDGNEVNLSMTVRYHIVPEMVGHIIQRVGTTNEEVERLVAAIARADIRTQMNILNTEEFFNRARLQIAVDKVRDAMNRRLRDEGIEVEAVIYDSHLFARRLADGTMDTSYQDQINATERKKQETLQELARNKTVEEEMKQKFAAAQGIASQTTERADGLLRQATERGNAKFTALSQDAERIYRVGMSEVEGMKSTIEALSGPGGEALLRLEVARTLMQGDSKFVVLNQKGNDGIDVNRLDTNELIRQMGAFTAAQEAVRPSESEKKITRDKPQELPPVVIPPPVSTN